MKRSQLFGRPPISRRLYHYCRGAESPVSIVTKDAIAWANYISFSLAELPVRRVVSIFTPTLGAICILAIWLLTIWRHSYWQAYGGRRAIRSLAFDEFCSARKAGFS